MHTKPFAQLNNHSQDVTDLAIDTVAHKQGLKWFSTHPYASDDLRSILCAPPEAVTRTINHLREAFIIGNMAAIEIECLVIEARRGSAN